MNYLGPPEAPDHHPLATLPCLPEQCSHCGKNFKQKTACLSTCWWSMEPERQISGKVLGTPKDQLCHFYITFKTRINFKEHMKTGAHMLAPGPAGFKGRFVREIVFLLDWMSVRGQSTCKREGSPL